MPGIASRKPAVIGVVVALLGPVLVVGARSAGLFPKVLLAERIGTAIGLWAITVLLGLLVVFAERKPLSSIGFSRPSWVAVLLGVGGAIVGVLLFPICAALLKAAGIAYPAMGAMATMAVLPLGARLIILISAAVTEETIYRGYAITRLGALTGSRWIAALISLAVFVALHLPAWGLAHLLYVTSVGGLLTVLFVWRKNLWTNIIAHGLIDAVPLLLLPMLGVRGS